MMGHSYSSDYLLRTGNSASWQKDVIISCAGCQTRLGGVTLAFYNGVFCIALLYFPTYSHNSTVRGLIPRVEQYIDLQICLDVPSGRVR
ncbi:hypothetical protein PoB_006689500 [Plakobranchus ocellatus]|uniref:Yippee domain-containing protein n=1 Tax=Plakobranchus ocellatus TaxID=259542 RepID=A0AAV4D8E0_9GAST|nr:hypothetical protein PoB_006689500 [Plakobranchus ocellatus]